MAVGRVGEGSGCSSDKLRRWSEVTATEWCWCGREREGDKGKGFGCVKERE